MILAYNYQYTAGKANTQAWKAKAWTKASEHVQKHLGRSLTVTDRVRLKWQQ